MGAIFCRRRGGWVRRPRHGPLIRLRQDLGNRDPTIPGPWSARLMLSMTCPANQRQGGQRLRHVGLAHAGHGHRRPTMDADLRDTLAAREIEIGEEWAAVE